MRDSISFHSEEIQLTVITAQIDKLLLIKELSAESQQRELQKQAVTHVQG